MKQEFINVALSQVGYKEQKIDGKGNYTKYGKWYGINPGAWCAMFVSWCADQAKVPKTLIPKYTNCGKGREFFEKQGTFTKTPHVGDIGFVMEKKRKEDGKAYTSAQHTFIVEYIDGNYVHTIEGNFKDKVKRNKRKIGYKDFKGLLFGNVKWEESHYTGEYPKLPSRGYFKKGDKGKEVGKLQKYLNWALDIKLQIDDSYGPITKDSVVRFEKLVDASKKNGLFGSNDLALAKRYTK